jgi:PadR family transcriptional regulator AphA
LAISELTATGRRPKTVYSITDAGRIALRDWHASRCALPSMEFEGLTRVFFGASGSAQQLIEAVLTAKTLADQIQNEGRMVGGEYLAGRYMFPDRVHFSGLTFDLLWSYADMLRDWSERAIAEIERWPDTSASDEKRERALAVFQAALLKGDDAGLSQS